MPDVSVPQIKIEDIMLNADNPFKRKMQWTRLRCRLCQEIVLGRPITKESDWKKVRIHLEIRHGINPGLGIPVRLLSHARFKQWLRSQKNQIKKWKIKEESK